MTPAELLPLLSSQRAVAILRTPHADRVRPAMDAAIAGGFRILEITLNTPGALARIAELAQLPDVTVGAGTVLSVEDARAAVDHGARFLVSPVTDPTVIDAALGLGVTPIPGAASPTEMLTAHRAGAPLQKLFPAPTNGPEYVRSCLGPMPFLRIVPTSGVDAGNAARYLDRGAFAVGFVRCLFDPEELDARAYGKIQQRARELLDIVRAVPAPPG